MLNRCLVIACTVPNLLTSPQKQHSVLQANLQSMDVDQKSPSSPEAASTAQMVRRCICPGLW